MEVLPDKIPKALKSRRQWCCWKHVERNGKPVKVPMQRNGDWAKSTDPATWCEFQEALDAKGFEGIGYVLSADDPFTGIDLDGCRSNGVIAYWARSIILSLNTYAEISPSGSGVKLLAEARLAMQNGKNKKLEMPGAGDKSAGIEVYFEKRFFTVTGQRLVGPSEPQPRQSELDTLCNEHWFSEMTLERARKYVSTMPPAISGQGGDKAAFRVACVLVKGFGLGESEAMQVMREYNMSCQPAWSEKELQRKVLSAARTTGPTGFLRDAGDLSKVRLPEFDRNDGLGDSLNNCIDILEPLDPKHRRIILASLQAAYR